MRTRWLNDRERRAWLGFHELRAGLTARLGHELARTSGLTESEYAILAVISEEPDHMLRARDLGLRLGWQRSRLSHQLRRMQDRGTVRREACPYDGRGSVVVITAEGLRAIEGAAPHHLETVRHCFIDLLTPQELDTLAQIAERVSTHLRTEHADEECVESGASTPRSVAR